jgi:hypothetical protein
MASRELSIDVDLPARDARPLWSRLIPDMPFASRCEILMARS